MDLQSIYVIFEGRCGNQMFQYACARAMQLRYGGKLYFDYTRFGFSDKELNAGFENSLRYFNIVQQDVVTRDKFSFGPITKRQYNIYFFLSRLYNWLNRVGRRNATAITYIMERIVSFPLQFFYGIYFIESPNSKWLMLPPLFHQKIVLRGYFESIDFFSRYSDIIRKELTPLEKYTVRVKELCKSLEGRNSICLTIRRGDFDSSAHSNRYKICDSEYYYKAVDYILSKESGCIVFVCSDDLEWCRNNICFHDTEVFFEPDGLTIPEKLATMSSCRHFVLSNSTFSWWAQFLSKDRGIVIAPSKWRNEVFSPSDIFVKEWIRMS